MGPAFSVIVATHNRAALLPRAVRSVLAQTYTDLEVVVVDDGSDDVTPEVIRGIDDARVVRVRQKNAGLAAARNAGVTASRGRFLAFLDDDDEACPGWLGAFANALLDQTCGIACCGATYIDADHASQAVLPRNLGPVFDDQKGLFIAGSFAVRRDVFDDVGGFATALPTSHQTELALRLIPRCLEKGLSIACTPELLLRVHRGHATARPRNRAETLLTGTRYIIEHHRERLARDPSMLADYLAVAAVSAARAGRYADARELLRQAIRARPHQAKNYGRYALATVPPLAELLWRGSRFRQTHASGATG